MTMQGDFRLKRQGGGRGAFAHVWVEVVPWQAGPRIVIAIDPADLSSVTPWTDPEWREAAIAGCQECLDALQRQGVEVHAYQIQVTGLVFNQVDTAPDAIWASAFLATAQAFGARERFRLVFQDRWTVVPA
jgi:hypothetical protein